MPEVLMIITAFLVFTGIFGVCIAQYVMQSVAMYTIAERKGIKHAYLAWLPIGESYVAGKIVDECDERMEAKKNWAKTLLTLALVGGVCFVITYVVFFAFLIVTAVSQNGNLDTLPLVPFVTLYVLLIAAALLLSAWSVMRMICTYKIYEIIVPEKAIKYMILSVIVPLGAGVCMLKAKNVLCAKLDKERAEEYKRALKEQLGQ